MKSVSDGVGELFELELFGVGDALGWMQTDAYLELAARSMQSRVRQPLLSRGIPLHA